VILLATDLDRTLIYSRAALEAGDDAALTAVEVYEGRDASWMTAPSAAAFARLGSTALVVPVTTRTPEQWARITLPGPPPKYVVTANGGVLLVDGEPDRDWAAAVGAGLTAAAPLREVLAHAERVCDPAWTRSLRAACNLFCYAVLDRARLPTGFVPGEAEWAAERGWRVSLQGRKLYWVPRSLTKSAAVSEVRRRAGASCVLAAGDSLLDADLLVAADRGIAARHGELVASGWSCPSVDVTEHSGVRAGAEIVDWFVARTDRS
jgi:hypothetical protein